jgi:hypothetical protein
VSPKPDENICERCTQTYEGDAQRCEYCGLDGLCDNCIATIDHDCEEEP